MALQTSGAISLLDVQGEFGGSTPIALDEYYRGAGLVPPGTPAGTGSFQESPLAPASPAQIQSTVGSPIQMSMFYGTTAVVNFNVVISANLLTGFNLRSTLLAAPYNWDGITPVNATVTVDSGVAVIGPDTSTPAFQTRTGVQPAFPSGSSITLINNGTIAGRGGAGGQGGGAIGVPSSFIAPTAGQAGGSALWARDPMTVINNGTIAGGGGGGGGGGAVIFEFDTSKGSWTATGGSGGGGGRSIGAGGLFGGAAGSGIGYGYNGLIGQSAVSGFGAGGAAVTYNGATNGAGGAGGDWGQPGQPGQTASGPGSVQAGAPGGSPGAAVIENSNIIWGNLGTILGTGWTSQYSLSASTASIDEGSGSVTITLTGPGVAGTTVPFTIIGVTSSDLNGAALSDFFTYPGFNTKLYTANPDSLTEGPESFTLRLTAPAGQTVAMPQVTVTINDTSVGAGSVIPSGSGTWQSTDISTSAVTASITFNSNGTVSLGASDFGVNPNWYTVTTPGIGSLYWIRVTATSTGAGSFTSSGLNTWLSLSGGWTLMADSGAALVSNEVVTFTAQFATDAAGTNIVATHTNNVVTAENDE